MMDKKMTQEEVTLSSYIGQEAGVTVYTRHTDEEVQNDFEVLWPTVC